MPPRRGWGNLVAWMATKISLQTELRLTCGFNTVITDYENILAD